MNRESIGRPIVLAFVLAGGTAAVWAALGGWSATMVEQFNYEPPLRQSLWIRDDGTPMIRSYVDYRDATNETLDGEVMPVDKPMNQLTGTSFRSHVRKDTFFLRKSWQQRIYPLSDGGKPEVFWYFVHDGRREGAGYFSGYERKTKQSVGYISKEGFSGKEPSRPSWFTIDGRDFPNGNALLTYQYYSGIREPDYYSGSSIPAWRVHLRCDSKLVEVDLRQHTAKTILEDPDLAAIGHLELPREKPDGSENSFVPSRYTLAARLKDRIVLVSTDGERVGSYRIPESLQNRGVIAYLLSEEQSLFTVSHRSTETGKEIVALYWADRDGKVLNERQVTLVGYALPADAGQVAWSAAGLFPVPGILTPAMIGLAPLAEKERGASDYWQGMERALPKIWPALLLVNFLGVVLAVLAVRRQRKFGLERQLSWATFVFLFGIPGYLAYLCHRRWPVREECPECHKPAPRDRDTCALCDAPFPAPEPKGIEVFA